MDRRVRVHLDSLSNYPQSSLKPDIGEERDVIYDDYGEKEGLRGICTHANVGNAKKDTERMEKHLDWIFTAHVEKHK